jgi:hypothetical protein
MTLCWRRAYQDIRLPSTHGNPRERGRAEAARMVSRRGPGCPHHRRGPGELSDGGDHCGDDWLFRRLLRLGAPSLAQPPIELSGSRAGGRPAVLASLAEGSLIALAEAGVHADGGGGGDGRRAAAAEVAPTTLGGGSACLVALAHPGGAGAAAGALVPGRAARRIAARARSEHGRPASAARPSPAARSGGAADSGTAGTVAARLVAPGTGLAVRAGDSRWPLVHATTGNSARSAHGGRRSRAHDRRWAAADVRRDRTAGASGPTRSAASGRARAAGVSATSRAADWACRGRAHPRARRQAIADVAPISRRSRAAYGIAWAASAARAACRAGGCATTASAASARSCGAGSRRAPTSATSGRSTCSAHVRPTAAVRAGLAGRATRCCRQEQYKDGALSQDIAHGHPPCGHVLQETAIPLCTDPSTEQTPAQDWRQSHEMGDVPQLLLPHVAITAPPAATKQS